MLDAFQGLWQTLLELISHIVIPDWGALIGLVPILLVIGLLGPLLSLLVLAWLVYGLRSPRRRLVPEPTARTAEIEAGRPVYPGGEPYCPTHRLIHPAGSDRCAVDGLDLVVGCPRCGTVRAAHRPACAACGLESRQTALPRLAQAAPPPGGAAAA